MKARTCPNCGYQYSLKEYYKSIFFKTIGLNWDCKNCGSLLTINFGRRILIIIIATLPLFLFGAITPESWNFIGLSQKSSLWVYVPLFLIWYLFSLSFDGFKLVTKNEADEAKKNKLV